MLDIELTGYHTKSSITQDVFNRWGPYSAEIESWGFDARNTSRIAAHEIVYGIEHRNDTVMSEYDEGTDLSYWAWDPEIGRFEEEGKVWGAYVQDHWQVTAPLLISVGARYDSYALDQVTYGDDTESDGFSGNAGLVYALTPDLAFSAGYAEAMRGKEVGDAFTLERRPGRITLAPDLDAERVGNAEAGLVYDNGTLRAGASVYQMEIRDVIMDQLGGGPAPQDATYYENVGTLEAGGIELRVGYSWDALRADLFYTTYDSELNGNTVEGYEQIGLANASGDAWNFSLGWTPVPDLELAWNLKHVQDLNDIVVLHRGVEIGWIDELQTVDKPGYTVNDIYLHWTPAEYDGFRLSFAVQNLFDVAYRDHASVADYNHIPDWEGVAGVREAGRDVRLTVAYDF
ncbi:TonB-dependent receptor [Parvularcula flava]|uniref:TonB-dependent receptor n=1 Tax=Aquisalinus luteolus TaxID=1566827 RepID=A0A8J3EV41_9PROT|nr:TonB-dependent receptor [Aquisalinus luteolus]NHK28706.1 TonB-dependent receptor [Aquisalinus luteolus]GGH99272.1 hypothetical protein GCM10011355_24840 [Aquisalinus luteolus]